MFSWSLQASADTNAKAENIWKLWSDVTSWATWDEVLLWCKHDGHYKQGMENKLKPLQWPTSPFRLTYVEPYKKYKDISRLPGTIIEFEYELNTLPNDQSIITNRISVKGMLAPLLRFTLKSKLQQVLPEAVKNLARMAEKQRL